MVTDGPSVELATVAARPTAVVRLWVTHDQLGASIVRALDDVWAFLRASDLAPGHNVVVYRGDIGAGDGAPVEVEVGVQVDRAPAGPTDGVVVAGGTPAGRAARAVHRGSYGGLPRTHQAVRDWCEANGHPLTGVSWEVYGDWTADPDALETEVFHELAD